MLTEAGHGITVEKTFHLDAEMHVRGLSLFLDDIPELEGTLYGAILGSPVSHGKLLRIDIDKASKRKGVIKVITFEDVPGQNQIGGIVADEPLLADGETHFHGQPVALVIASSYENASAARTDIKLEFEELPVVTDPRRAYAKGDLLHHSRTFRCGDTKSAFDECKYIFSGRTESGGQEHLYLEGQAAYAIPVEYGGIRVHSSTQGPTQVQRTVSRVLGIPMHKVEVDVTRLGGGFGGKEDQASCWGAMAALGAWLTGKPVKVVLHRLDDIRMTGKRHPYSSDYRIGLDEELKIKAYQAVFYQNGGAAADLSPAVLERTLFHATNSYFIPNVEITAHCCRTNLPPNTAFRGFGGPQGMFVIESAIHHAAREIGVKPHEIQEKNLLVDGNQFSYGQIVSGGQAKNCWRAALDAYRFERIEREIDGFNADHKLRKRGMAVMPVCFGISFTNTQMNSGRALVHVYSDGSVGISTGAVEMGQGVNTKLVQIAAGMFGLPESRIKLESTNTTRVSNTSPSAASSTTDLNGKALLDAGTQIKRRLNALIAHEQAGTTGMEPIFTNEKVLLGNQFEISWDELIHRAFMARINLSAKGHYATPEINFDKKTEKGHPFAYHVYGTAIIVCEVDCLRGTYEFISVKVVHDFGASMNRAIDLGQCEGGIVQGLGWMTMEEVLYDSRGRLLSNALSTYKIPDIYAVPKEIEVKFLETSGHEGAVLKSKAVGEPPLMYGIGGYFALANAIRSFNPKARMEYSAPMTPEKALLALYKRQEE